MPHRPTAVILAAGPGSRLLPHTAHTPKCLTEIGGQPILRHQIAALRECGIHDIVIVVGYLADKIRARVDSSIALVENREYATTNSSYSLWLARNFLRGGFIHLNSDLLFEPDLLRALLASSDENAVIVDRHVRPGSDMMKARMEGRRILRMQKDLTFEASAEVVGPVKFGPCGADVLINRLAHLTEAGDRGRWAYSVFGELASELALAGVDNPGSFWAEVDTAADAREANRRIPPTLVELASREDSWRSSDELSPGLQAAEHFRTHAS
jgi:choline kinase